MSDQTAPDLRAHTEATKQLLLATARMQARAADLPARRVYGDGMGFGQLALDLLAMAAHEAWRYHATDRLDPPGALRLIYERAIELAGTPPDAPGAGRGRNGR